MRLRKPGEPGRFTRVLLRYDGEERNSNSSNWDSASNGYYGKHGSVNIGFHSCLLMLFGDRPDATKVAGTETTTPKQNKKKPHPLFRSD